jgi:OOP family OmpA-OmpF porin
MNRLLLFLSLLLLGLISFLCIRNHAPAIEINLATRTSTALYGEGLDWAEATMDGRELVLTGVAPSAELRETANQLASSILGVRSVDNRITVAVKAPEVIPAPEAASPTADYSTEFLLRDNDVVLTGMVPDQETHEKLIGIAEQRFGTQNVMDQLEIQSGAPDGWHQSIEALLTQLYALKEGSALIVNTEMTISGSTSSETIRERLETSISNSLHADFHASYDIDVVEPKPEVIPKPEPEPEITIQESALSCQKRFNDLLEDQRIQFKFNSSEINSESHELLDNLVEAANECPDVNIEIGGHTDSQGSEAYNSELSGQRAAAVGRYLTGHGIRVDRLIAVGFGELSPIASNGSVEGRAKNRRIEFKVMGK